MFALFLDLKRYVGFTTNDEALLRGLHPRLSPHFEAIAEEFYARAVEHPTAAAALTRGERRVGQLKVTLQRWMNDLLTGPWDEVYVERQARIGKVHVQIALPQHFMVSAMNVMRSGLKRHASTIEERLALDRICDLELALMLHTYRANLEIEQARAERLNTYGQLVESIGQELRDPLSVIETSLHILKGKPADDETCGRHLDRIGRQVKVSNDIITQLTNLIVDRPLVPVRTSLAELIEEARRGLTVPSYVTVEVVGPPCPFHGDTFQLRQAVVCLLDNALHFARTRVRLSMEETADQVRLHVDDDGPGIDPSVLSRLFEPLVSARPGGIGLGLALVRRITERHGGGVERDAGPLGGARFTLSLQKGTP